MVFALDQTWHNNCFICSMCLKIIGNETFQKRKDKPVCMDCLKKCASVCHVSALILAKFKIRFKRFKN